MATMKKNRAQCLKCLEIIESKDIHRIYCKCGAIFVSGGIKTPKNGSIDAALFKELYQYDGSINFPIAQCDLCKHTQKSIGSISMTVECLHCHADYKHLSLL